MTHRVSRAVAPVILTMLLTLHPAAVRAGLPRPPPPPLQCSSQPEMAAIAFFEFVESHDGEALRGSARELLARSLQLSLEEVLKTVANAKAQYKLDRYDAPLSDRLTDAPRRLARGNPGWDPEAQETVRLVASTSRGRIEQHASLTCEGGMWRVVSFAYVPLQQR